MKKKKGFSTISDVLGRVNLKDDTDKYISKEFQKYGYDLAQELGDTDHASLYIKLAKETPRGILETARGFIKDAENVKSKPALFLWKMKKLKEENKKKE